MTRELDGDEMCKYVTGFSGLFGDENGEEESRLV